MINAATYSWAGMRSAFKHEESFRIEFILCCLLAPLAFWLGRNGLEQALMIGSLFLVLIVELVNSSIEATVDRIGKEPHELAGRAKDMGSAAIFFVVIECHSYLVVDYYA